MAFLAGFVEYQVPLPGGDHPSQNDFLILAKNKKDLAVIAVEGKVSEPFGETVGEWLETNSKGKNELLKFINELPGINLYDAKQTRYQLAHRTASALIEAERYNASTALMLVHSFSPTNEWFSDYSQFASLFGIQPQLNRTHKAKRIKNTDLYLAWVSGEST